MIMWLLQVSQLFLLHMGLTISNKGQSGLFALLSGGNFDKHLHGVPLIFSTKINTCQFIAYLHFTSVHNDDTDQIVSWSSATVFHAHHPVSFNFSASLPPFPVPPFSPTPCTPALLCPCFHACLLSVYVTANSNLIFGNCLLFKGQVHHQPC